MNYSIRTDCLSNRAQGPTVRHNNQPTDNNPGLLLSLPPLSLSNSSRFGQNQGKTSAQEAWSSPAHLGSLGSVLASSGCQSLSHRPGVPLKPGPVPLNMLSEPVEIYHSLKRLKPSLHHQYFTWHNESWANSNTSLEPSLKQLWRHLCTSNISLGSMRFEPIKIPHYHMYSLPTKNWMRNYFDCLNVCGVICNSNFEKKEVSKFHCKV